MKLHGPVGRGHTFYSSQKKTDGFASAFTVNEHEILISV